MTSVGETLRRERLNRNLTLDRISNELKISARFLEAIEQDRFERLPGGVFTKSFVRQYAQFLGLDVEEITAEIQRILEPPVFTAETNSKPPDVTPIVPLPRVREWETIADERPRWASSLPAFALVILVMLVCSGVYTWWQRAQRRAATHESAPAIAARVNPASKPATPAPAQLADSAAPAPVPPPGAASADASPATSPDTNPRPNAERQAATPAPDSASAAPVHVQVTAQEPVWVSVRADGKFSFSGTLQANESRTIDANGSVVLRLGNAGGATILLNGKPIGPVGPKGQVRTLQLTSGGFKIVPPEDSNADSPAPFSLDPL